MITIRQAGIQDIDQLTELFDDYRVFYNKISDINGAKEFLSERLSQMDSVIFVAEDPSCTLSGFVQLYPVFSSTQMKRLWLLNDLFVKPAFRGMRISIKLIDSAKEHAIVTQSCGLMLETAKTNVIGNRLYPKTGFVLDEVSNYYHWGC